MKTTLPQPSPEALAHSECLRHKIQAAIELKGGAISFDHYMQMALYEPGLGYYSAGSQKFGQAGDFVTAPEISPLFSRCVARQCVQILNQVANGSILEIGAGSGIMASTLLQELTVLGCLPQHYYILEVSAELRQRQQHLLAQTIPSFSVTWLDHLPESFEGIILANEVMDALPVKLVAIEDNQCFERMVISSQEGQFDWGLEMISDPNLITWLTEQKAQGLLSPRYITEFNQLLSPWINSLAKTLKKGAILLIDYGFPRHEYYHPQRNHGTLMCHYRHHAHSDPFYMPGLQDITAHVDFTAVAESAINAGLQVAGYNTQAGFLLGCGLMPLIKELSHLNANEQFAINKQIQQLTSPAEMGELFKVIALTRKLDINMMGFSQQDLRGRL